MFFSIVSLRPICWKMKRESLLTEMFR